ncbi:MAG: histidine phosphatase family protein [Planctomycetota bacterium]
MKTLMKSQAVVAPILLIRPGSTDFDEQHRIKGSLDMPMSDEGHEQVALMINDVATFRPKTIYAAPCESARQTAEALSEICNAKVKTVEEFVNVDHGLWHGKLIDELRRNHPKIYKRAQEAAEEVCPPGGESLPDATRRIEKIIKKITKRRGGDVIALVVPDPLAGLVRGLLCDEPLVNLWDAETDQAQWNLIEPAIK